MKHLINFDVKQYDTHNAVTTGASWGFRAPTAGIYRVSATFYTSTSSRNLRLFKNGSVAIGILGYTGVNSLQISTSIQLLAGDIIDLRFQISPGSTIGGATLATADVSHIEIERIGI